MTITKIIKDLEEADDMVNPRVIADDLIQARKEARDRMLCQECKLLCWGSYMVHDHVWRLTGLEPKGGHLHLWCLAKRIGRDLVIEDFRPLPVNDNLFYMLQGKRP